MEYKEIRYVIKEIQTPLRFQELPSEIREIIYILHDLNAIKEKIDHHSKEINRLTENVKTYSHDLSQCRKREGVTGDMIYCRCYCCRNNRTKKRIDEHEVNKLTKGKKCYEEFLERIKLLPYYNRNGG